MNEKPTEPRLPLYLSMDNPEPMYAQIESQLRDLILSDVLEPGTKLPSIRALARDLTCSVITTRRAYEDLEREGFILTRVGRGTVVAQIPEEKMNAHRREAVDVAFREAVRAGGRAGFTREELREIFEEILE
jgi:GntR family transcriptional regulator